jgi:hypothetical protein
MDAAGNERRCLRCLFELLGQVCVIKPGPQPCKCKFRPVIPLVYQHIHGYLMKRDVPSRRARLPPHTTLSPSCHEIARAVRRAELIYLLNGNPSPPCTFLVIALCTPSWSSPLRSLMNESRRDLSCCNGHMEQRITCSARMALRLDKARQELKPRGTGTWDGFTTSGIHGQTTLSTGST